MIERVPPLSLSTLSKFHRANLIGATLDIRSRRRNYLDPLASPVTVYITIYTRLKVKKHFATRALPETRSIPRRDFISRKSLERSRSISASRRRRIRRIGRSGRIIACVIFCRISRVCRDLMQRLLHARAHGRCSRYRAIALGRA